MWTIFSWVISTIFAYFFFKPYLKHPETRKKIFKGVLILFPLAVLFSILTNYLIESGQPDSFNEGVELVKKEKKINDQIGTFKSLMFNKNNLPQKTDNPAQLKFELEGYKGTILIECKVKKDHNDNWQIIEITKDSLIQIYN